MLSRACREDLFRTLLGAWITLALGCETSQPQKAPSAPEPQLDAATTDAAEPPETPIDPRCIAPEGVSTEPHSIADVVALLNALPKPVTIPCFIDALHRPLALHAIESQFSAQPSDGPDSPRVFIFFPGLIMSVVAAGEGAHLLELGESRPDDLSLKAELELPITAHLDAASPYERTYFDGNLTTCGFCHQGEHHDDTIASPLAFISPALRPFDEQRVFLDDLDDERVGCADSADEVTADDDAGEDHERCAILRALLRRAPRPIEHEFPSSYKEFL